MEEILHIFPSLSEKILKGLHWEKFYTRETEVRIEVVHIQSQLVVQIENFAFLNEIQWLEWAYQSNA